MWKTKGSSEKLIFSHFVRKKIGHPWKFLKVDKKVGVRSIFIRENFRKMRLFQFFRGQIHKNQASVSETWSFLPVKKPWKSQKSAREKKRAWKKSKKWAWKAKSAMDKNPKNDSKCLSRPLLVSLSQTKILHVLKWAL